MKVIEFSNNDIVIEDINNFIESINKKELKAIVIASINKDNIIETYAKGTLINQSGLLSFLQENIHSQMKG
jgi:ABC-type Zn uptake system ZnuABC Zn-binding protein ZnuA